MKEWVMDHFKFVHKYFKESGLFMLLRAVKKYLANSLGNEALSRPTFEYPSQHHSEESMTAGS